jgi:hypothetical protein
MTVKCPNCSKGNNALPNMKKTTCKSCGVPFDIPQESPKTASVAPEVALEKKEEPLGGESKPKFDVW